eukprot:g15064.t1
MGDTAAGEGSLCVIREGLGEGLIDSEVARRTCQEVLAKVKQLRGSCSEEGGGGGGAAAPEDNAEVGSPPPVANGLSACRIREEEEEEEGEGAAQRACHT